MSSLRYTAVTYEVKKESIERITVNQMLLIWPIFPFEWKKNNVIHFMRHIQETTSEARREKDANTAG